MLVMMLAACSDNPEAEGKALAKDYCAAVKKVESDPMKAMALAEEFGKKAEALAEKYGDSPTKSQQLMSGYLSNITSCIE